MRRYLLSIAMAGLLPAGAAFAQQSPSGAGAYPEPAPAPSTESVPPATEPAPAPSMGPSTEAAPPPAYEPVPAAAPAHKRAMAGPTAHAEAGLLAFPGNAHNFINPGFSYGAGIGVDAAQAVGLELNYQGAAYGTKESVGVQESIAENGGEALLKLGPKTKVFDAYALGGYGLTFINVAERNAASPVQDDWVSKVPVGLGVDVKVPTSFRSDVRFGARSTYDFVFNNDAYRGVTGLNDANSSARSGDQINTQLTLGGKF